MSRSVRSLLLHGSPEPLPSQRHLRAGPLALVFEAGDLRYVTLHGREVVRRIYGAVRDREWRTVPGVLTELHLDAHHDRFVVRYCSEHREHEVHFVWSAHIEGSADGEVVFDFAGEARSSFERNRIGLCVLHPIAGYAGARARARGPNGTLRDVTFPALVAVEQPIEGFTDLAGLSCDDGAVEVLFTGDVFETEDQRNWIDASFKTYSTPLSLPRPVRLAAGTRIEQRVTLRVRPECAARVAATGRHAPAEPLRPPDPGDLVMPAVGTAVGADESWTPLADSLRPAHLRVAIDCTAADWRTTVAAAVRAHRVARCPVELAVTLPGPARAAADALVLEWPPDVPIARVLPVSSGHPTTTPAAFDAVRAAFASGAGPAVGAGSSMDLYEFHLFPPPSADFYFWGMNPHAHASDVTSLAETPEAAGDQVRAVRGRHPHARFAIAPVTIRPRTSSPAAGTAHPLQGSLLAAAWTLAMAAHLAHGGAASVTFFERLSDTCADGHTPHPVFHVLADLCECAGRRLVPPSGSEPLLAGGQGAPVTLFVSAGSRGTLLVANLSRRRCSLSLRPDFVPESVRLLDEGTARQAAADPGAFRMQTRTAPGLARLDLEPFATARLDGELADVR